MQNTIKGAQKQFLHQTILKKRNFRSKKWNLTWISSLRFLKARKESTILSTNYQTRMMDLTYRYRHVRDGLRSVKPEIHQAAH